MPGYLSEDPNHPKRVDDVLAAHVLALAEDRLRVVLDCGDYATPDLTLVPEWRTLLDTPGMGAAGAAGYATMRDGRRICYAHADQSEREAIAAAGGRGERFTAYVSGDGRAITTWTGGVLARVTEHGSSRSGFYDSMIHYWTATTPDGRVWFGRNGGTGMAITLRPRKPRA